MKIIDISWPISQKMTGYKDKKVVKFSSVKTFEKDGARDSIICLGTHTGTHVDTPSHFLTDGTRTDQLKLTQLVGSCLVIDCTDVVEKITDANLQKHEITKDKIILLKTKNSQLSPTESFDYNFVYLDFVGARYLADIGVKAVGIDYLGLERDQKNHPSHKALMKNNISIIEGLRLDAVKTGEYFFVCLPLAIVGLEASPVRAVLIEHL